MALETAAIFVPRYLQLGASHPMGDWLFFKTGAFQLVQLPQPNGAFSGNPLHLYAANPALQIGPPPLVTLAVLQHYLSPTGATLLLTILMALAGLAIVATLERLAVALCGAGQRIRVCALVGGVVLVGFWTDSAVAWRHLDDVVALTAVAVAMLVCARGGRWWVMAGLLGLAAATKPWAIVAAPLLMGLPREQRARAVVVLLATAGAWWAPFVLAAPDTVSSLGRLSLVPMRASVPYLLGIHGDVSRWLRPLQFGVGIAAGIIVARKRSWLAVPLVALSIRVASDPYVWSYYGLGPLMIGLGIDLVIGRRSLPKWTIGAALVFFVLPMYLPADLCAVARLAWCLAMAWVCWVAATRSRDPARRQAPGLPQGSPVFVVGAAA